jgi:hypothetical protein
MGTKDDPLVILIHKTGRIAYRGTSINLDLVSGVVKVFKTSAEGREQVLTVMRHGDSFNDVSLFDDIDDFFHNSFVL